MAQAQHITKFALCSPRVAGFVKAVDARTGALAGARSIRCASIERPIAAFHMLSGERAWRGWYANTRSERDSTSNETKEVFSGFNAMDILTSPYALVVDDDAIILLDACDILESAGFRFYEAGTGDEAIELLEKHAEDVTLLFSDVEMPGKTNGFALARHVAHHWPWIEIVIASGRVEPSPSDMPAKASFHSETVQSPDGT